jgi:hypothetical protein
MSLNSAETIVKSAGDVYRAPLGTGVPLEADLDDHDTLVATGWVHMGWLHEDGPTFDGWEGEVQSFNGWNRQAPVRVRSIIGEPTVTTPLTQWNVENAGLYFPGSTIDGPTGNLIVPTTPGSGTEQELLVVVQDGTEFFGLWVAKTSPRPGGPLEFPGDDFSQIIVTFDVLAPDDDTDGLAQVIGLEAAESV